MFVGRMSTDEPIDALVDAAIAARPSLAASRAELRAHLQAVAGEDAPSLLPHAADLALAFACALRDERAIAELLARHEPEIRAAVARVRAPEDVRAEVVQILSERLLVGPDGRPRLLDYGGRAPLSAWIRAAAVRAALDLRKKKAPELAPSASREPELVADGDPELRHMQERYGKAFREAFADAFSELTEGDRAILRMSVVEQLGVDGIAGVLGVHRATAARWASQARDRLAARTQEIVAERLSLQPSELASIARLCDSVIDLSIARVLG